MDAIPVIMNQLSKKGQMASLPERNVFVAVIVKRSDEAENINQ
ncbi:hypothetical protein ACERK3_18830 [Phycisphaerales bacterium AB-hyl4]|uniref:Uncharacterized protein n=1 Tax=Natronomicrosphaera hydrolytica TaxID=3242702 RepID=A0ABV4U9N9_9BACT